MKKNKQHNRSLQLLDKFLKETPPEEIEKMFKEIDDMKFGGPTISEYFSSMDGIHAFQQLQNEIKKWSDETFGRHRTGTPIAYHLKKEIDELIDALNEYHNDSHCAEKRNRIKFEAVDCLTLLIDVTAHEQINMYDLFQASLEKLEINKNRKWGKPDENGVVEHIKE